MIAQDIRIGTAGWSVPARYAPDFPAEGSHLARYARVLNGVEINTSFYRPHQPKTYERWASETPPGFRFAVKAPKAATHEARLVDVDAILDRFCGEIGHLGEKLGPVLVQLPPSLPFDVSIADAFFQELSARTTALVVCEPRHASWFTADVETFLADRRIARAAADPAPAPGADKPGGWTGIAYYRLHGSPRIYYSDYEPDALETIGQAIQASPVPVWCVFDNTAAFHAAGNALWLARRTRAALTD